MSATHNPEEALRLIQEIRARGGHVLSDQAALTFITKPFKLFSIPMKRRGPKTKKSPYDLANERRKDAYRRLVTLRKGVRRGTGLHDEKHFIEEFRRLRASGISERRLVKELVGRLIDAGMVVPDDSTLRRYKRKSTK